MLSNSIGRFDSAPLQWRQPYNLYNFADLVFRRYVRSNAILDTVVEIVVHIRN